MPGQTTDATIELITRGEQETIQALEDVGREMGEVGDAAERLNRRSGRLGRGLQGLQKNMGAMAAAGAALGTAVFAVEKRQITLIAAQNAVNFALRSQGIAFEASRNAVNDLLVSISRLGATDLPVLQKAFGELLPITQDAQLSMEGIRVAVDLAAATGKSFQEAFALIQGVFRGDEGVILALQEMGIEVTLTLDPMGNLALISLRVAGAAEKSATSLQKLTVRLREGFDKAVALNQALGGWPVVVGAAAAVVLGLAVAIGALVAVSTPVTLTITAVVVALAVLAVGVALLVENWDTAWAFIQETTARVVRFLQDSPFRFLVFLLGPMGVIALGLAFIAKHWDTIWGGIQSVTGAVVNALRNGPFAFLARLFGSQGAIAKALGFILGFWSAAWRNLQRVAEDWWGIVRELFEDVLRAVGRIWGGIEDVFKGAIQFVAGVFTGDWSRAWDGVVLIFEGVKDVVLGLWDLLVAGIKAQVNVIISLLNVLIRAMNSIPNVKIPDWVTGFGGRSFGLPNIPEIPRLQRGTPSFGGGMAVVGERGPELVSLPRGAAVTPIAGEMRLVIELDGDVLAEKVIPRWTREVRLQGV